MAPNSTNTTHTPEPPPGYKNAQEIAAELGVHYTTVARTARELSLPFINRPRSQGGRLYSPTAQTRLKATIGPPRPRH